MPFTIIEAQPTPNPNAMKYVLDRPIAPERLSFVDAASASEHPLASRLFRINGVSSLLMLGDFITVVKTPTVKWSAITGKVKKALAGA